MAGAGDIDISSGGVRVRITGLSKTLRAMEKAGASSADMKDLMHALGTTVVTAAVPRARHATGAMASTIRAGRGKTKAVVRAGGARVPYAGAQHYGWPRRGITPNPYLRQAVDTTLPRLLDQLDAGIAKLLKDANL